MSPLTLYNILTESLTVSSPAFYHNGYIPAKYSCDGLNINPTISIGDIPLKTKSLALIIEDPDAPEKIFDHWVMWNIPVTDTIEEDSTPGTTGQNGKGQNKYTGPCPPDGEHHYHFKIYALDKMIDLPSDSDKRMLEKAMDGHIIGTGELIGLYKKDK